MTQTSRKRPEKPLPFNRKQVFVDLIFLAAVLWVAHFWYFRLLGLYEDDYTHTSPAFGWQLPDLMTHTLIALRAWDLGRPLGLVLGQILAFIGWQLGGLGAAHILAYLIHLTNAFLFYFLLRRIGQARVAVIGATIFGLFPADTTHIFLMHAFGLHTSLTFLLLAAHAYLRGHKALAHGLSLGCLLIYESPYMVFVAIPLLCRPWDHRLIREMRRHVAVWLAILVAVVVVRALMGESRIGDVGSSAANVVVISKQILAALVIGPAVSLSTFWQGPIWIYFHWNRELTDVFWLSLLACVSLLTRTPDPSAEPGAGGPSLVQVPSFGGPKEPRFRLPHSDTLKLLLTGLIMLSLAYGLSFTHFPPTDTYGRATSVHLAAAFGAALVFTCISSFLLPTTSSHLLRVGGVLVLSVYLSWLVVYRFSIQQDFKRAWQIERYFWSAVVAKVPDMTEGTMIIVVDKRPSETRFIFASSWANPLILQQIFRFPPEWKTPPRLWVVQPDWTTSLATSGGQITWIVPLATGPAHTEPVPQGNIVVMVYKDDKLIREQEPLTVDGLTLQLRVRPPGARPIWQAGALYPLLILSNR